jgi:hypothetical protein
MVRLPTSRPYSHLRFISAILGAGSLVLCSLCGVIITNLRPNEQSTWVATEGVQLEMGPEDRTILPYAPDKPIFLTPSATDPSGARIASYVSVGMRSPSGAHVTCEYAGDPVITIANVSVRVWKCEP